ncbi:nitroreductase family deazaflavin-dependent oxidoreductase [Microbacterium protaetiae]|uniref:Nitroreductase family deazaflavin-dependent oxidoreductase n=1 Tax=Microbacterium protaetiae TaxID=2509458 RepID=A0A4P6ERJ8_9MICO|nr:nitroreductase family deazaflavin-dependent oxidoreductase [Microbacterium protaetiae]QAY60538.1 nitroreductase family deazaflavin-dependent oxidoreductase [Microbacterium protaetiae]
MPSIRQAVRRTLAPLTQTALFRRVGRHLMPVLEAAFRVVSRGKMPISGILVPSLTLHTIGARSGEPRAVELMYTPDGGGSAIVAGTNFAGARHPAWTANLIAHPDAEIVVRGRRLAVHAERIADSAARDAAWVRIEAQWPNYRSYERDSGRTVRLFRLRPVRELGRV